MSFFDPISQWQSQAQLVPVWEEYPPPFNNETPFLSDTSSSPSFLFPNINSHYNGEQQDFCTNLEVEEEPFSHQIPGQKITFPENSSPWGRPNPLKLEPASPPLFMNPIPPDFHLPDCQDQPFPEDSEPEYPSETSPLFPPLKGNPPLNLSPDLEMTNVLPENIPKPEQSDFDLSQEDLEGIDDDVERVEMSEEETEPSSGRKRRSSSDSISQKRNSENNSNLGEEGGVPKNPTQKKKRQRTSPEQLQILEKVYEQEKLPSVDLRKELAEQLQMTPRRVQVWFQNKRAKEKRLVAAHQDYVTYGQ